MKIEQIDEVHEEAILACFELIAAVECAQAAHVIQAKLLRIYLHERQQLDEERGHLTIQQLFLFGQEQLGIRHLFACQSYFVDLTKNLLL